MKLTTREMILIGLFAALMAVGAYIKVPNPLNPDVPITFQLFFSIYAGVLLGSRKGLISQLTYILIGLMGVPVFTNGGGFAYIFKPSFGYIIGFAFCAFITGLIVENLKGRTIRKVMFGALAGLAVAYLIGNTWLFVALGGKMTWMAVALMMTGYMIKDFILAVVIAITSASIVPAIRKAGYVV